MRVDALTARIWRPGIAFVIAFDAVQLVIRTRMRAPLTSAILPVPQAFRDLAGSLPLLILAAAVTCAAALSFARGRATLASGVVALIANRLLLEAFAALDGIYDETSYFASSAMLGWIFGALFARAIGEQSGSQPDRSVNEDRDVDDRSVRGARGDAEIDRYAALGAAAMFAATYLNAGTAKMRDSGLSWADGDTIRLLVLAHTPAGVPSWLGGVRWFAGQSAGFAAVASAGTLVIQLGAVVFPWTRRTRLVWGSLFVAFHVGIHLVAGSIFFLQAVFLAALFAVPWPSAIRKLLKKPSVSDDPEPPAPTSGRRRLVLVSAAVAATLALLVALPIRPRAHPIERLPGAEPSPARAPAASTKATALGPFTIDAEIADGWILQQIEVDTDHAALTIARGSESVILDVSARAGAARGPFDTGDLHISYRGSLASSQPFAGAAESIGRRIEEEAHGRPLSEAFRAWIVAARGSY